MDTENFHHFTRTVVLDGSCFGMISFCLNDASGQLNRDKYQFSDERILYVMSTT